MGSWSLPSASLRLPQRSPAWFDLPVPTAALTRIEVSLDEGRTLAAPRAIRVLHTIPREGELPPPLVEFEQLLTDLDAVEKESLRAGAQGLRLEMAKNSSEQDVLKDTLESMGLHLRERRGAYSVELNQDGDAVKLRKRLDAAGIHTGAIEKALNGGNAVLPSPAITILPSPLAHDVWETAIFERPIPPRSLFSAIMRDRRAALLFYGLLSMTPETRAYLAKDRQLLRRLYRDVAGPVAAFGSSFRVGEDGHPIVPGGADAVELWEALADVRLEQTDQFAHAIFSRSDGRLAYLFDTVSHLDAPHQRFALGMWIKDRGVRLERFRALYRAFADIDPAWKTLERPFARPLNDPSTMLALVAVGAQGEPAAPAYRRFWDRAFTGIDVPSAGTRELKDVFEDGVVDAAWLAEHVLQGLALERKARLGCFAFGQRVFASASAEELDDALVAIRACMRFPALVMTLERAGLRRPATYALAARRARAIEDVGDPVQAVPLLAQFQSALLLLERMSRTGAIPESGIDGLVSSLCMLETASGRYDGAFAAWIEMTLLPALAPPSGDSNRALETSLLRALADTAEAAPFEWEGAKYITDVTATSLRDLVAIRAKQGGNSLDAVMALSRAFTPLQQNGLTLDALKTHTASLKAAGDRLVAARAWPDMSEEVPDVKKIVERAVRDLMQDHKAQRRLEGSAHRRPARRAWGLSAQRDDRRVGLRSLRGGSARAARPGYRPVPSPQFRIELETRRTRRGTSGLAAARHGQVRECRTGSRWLVVRAGPDAVDEAPSANRVGRTPASSAFKLERQLRIRRHPGAHHAPEPDECRPVIDRTRDHERARAGAGRD